MANNKITRDDIISPDAFDVLKDYRKAVKKAIKANKRLKKSIKELTKNL